MSSQQPLLLTLDDLIWTDPASIELICHLLAHQPQASLLLALAYRPAQLPTRLATTLDTAAREGTAERVELGPLSPRDADTLIWPGVARATREQLHQHSGGNPFYLEQLIRETQHPHNRHIHEPAGVSTDGVPAAVRKALANELDHLSTHARMMLQGAAVAGDPFEHDLAAHTATLDDTQALPALDELLERDLVRSHAIPGRFRFRHPIVRAAVYETTGAGWRLAAHARIAAALGARGAAPTARAHHIEHSARPGDQTAIAVLTQAGQTAAPRAPATAARWFAAALRLLTDEHAAPQRLELHVALATALGSAGQLHDSHLALCRALELVGPEHARLRVHLIATCANVERMLGHHHDAHNRLTHALEPLGNDAHSPEAATLMLELAVDSLFTCDFAASRARAVQACGVAEGIGDRGLVIAATGVLALAGYALGDTTSAGAHLDQAAARLDELTDDELAARLDAAYYLGWAEHWMERLDGAIRHLQRGIAVSRATGQGHLLVPMMLGTCLALSMRGRLAEAGELADAAVDASRLSGSAQVLSWALWVRSALALVTGDLPAALAAGQESVALARTLDSFLISATYGSVLAPTLLEIGQAEQCRTALLAAVSAPDTLVVPVAKCACYALLTHAELALGHVESAREWSLRAEATAHGLGLRVVTGLGLRARAAVLLADGQARPSAKAALAAAELAEGTGARIEAARSRILAGRALASSGERKAAVRQLEQAAAELAACSANRYHDQAVRELRRLGSRVGRPRSAGPGATHPGSLTEREQEIAELVVAGKTNRAIARALYISEKTVEAHLSRIFTKLGISSRTAMASIVVRHRERDRTGLNPAPEGDLASP
ncbi:MAG: LuxR C-terminal-related transcriptional regulator [Egibacteraceae bacterium]